MRTSRARWLTLLLTIGPGILAMAGDNDAGGLLAYISTGARYGASFFLPLLVPSVAMAFVVQEMAMRLGVVSGRSFSALLRERVHPSWGCLAAVDLAVQNWFLLTTEFAGMALGLAHFGVPLAAGVPLTVALVAGLVAFYPYRTAERLALVLAVLSLVFLPLAIMHHPALSSVRLWPAHRGPGFAFFAVAAVGNALAPWMIFFQAQAVHDKGITARQLRPARLDLVIGSLLQVVVAAAALLLAAGTVSGHGAFNAQGWLDGLGGAAGDLVAIGLFDAGLVATITVSLSSAWAVAETFTGRPGCPGRPREAPLFYGVYLIGLVSAAAVTLLPGVPLDLIAVGAQAAAAILMPPVLALLVLLASDAGVMSAHRNGRWISLAGMAATAVFMGSVLVLGLGGMGQ